MRIVCISDTHGRHGSLTLPAGDVLIHAGDFMSGMGGLDGFAAWLGGQPHAHKVVVAGNGEPVFESDPARARAVLADAGVVYLQDSGCEIGGLRFWGTPWQPRFVGSFNLDSRAELESKWQLIPDDIDVLISHTPPGKILDRTSRGLHVGCPGLRAAVLERVRPRLHVFGHVHDCHGEHDEGGVHFVNAASLGRGGMNPPIVVELA